ncbi:MAG: TIGR00303 family protein [Synergistaceae bacterium]|nr:TIGR00303 family protein [Synergistaceae bacterium]
MFVLFISETELSKVPGLSAAGADTAALPYTAPADADMLFFDRPKVVDSLPLDPFGHPSPAIVTRAALLEGKFPVMTVRAGTSISPGTPFTNISSAPGRDPRYGAAVPGAVEIAEKAKMLAEEISRKTKRVVIAESIPGGTTTALMLLRTLGYEGTVSSAGPVNPLSLKEEIWNTVSSRLGIRTGGLRGWGVGAAAEVGDPMQVAASSFAEALPADTEVILAGGTQMLAVAALMRDMGDSRPLLVATTKYVSQDATSCFKQYAEKIGVDYYSAPIDFSHSKYQGLADYEKGFVKEGVGMGGAIWYALQNGATIGGIIKRAESLYGAMVGK